MRQFVVVLGLTMICSNGSAQQKPNIPVVVNGNLIPSKTIAGHVFVRPEEFAKAIGATVSYSNGGIIVTLAPAKTSPVEVPTQAPVSTTGTIKGALSYYFNSNFGNRPDSGSKIFLVEGQVTIDPGQIAEPPGPNEPLEVFGGNQPSHEYPLVKQSISDGSGNFELDAVPEGEYTIIIESNHTVNDREIHKYFVDYLTVKPDEVLDVSHDFGISAY